MKWHEEQDLNEIVQNRKLKGSLNFGSGPSNTRIMVKVTVLGVVYLWTAQKHLIYSSARNRTRPMCRNLLNLPILLSIRLTRLFRYDKSIISRSIRRLAYLVMQKIKACLVTSTAPSIAQSEPPWIRPSIKPSAWSRAVNSRENPYKLPC